MLIVAFQKLLKLQFSHLTGLQDDILGLTLAFEIEAAELSKSSTLALVIG